MANNILVKKMKKSNDKIVYTFTFLVQISVKHLPILTIKVVNNYTIKTNISNLWTMFSNLFNYTIMRYIFDKNATKSTLRFKQLIELYYCCIIEQKTTSYNSNLSTKGTRYIGSPQIGFRYVKNLQWS